MFLERNLICAFHTPCSICFRMAECIKPTVGPAAYLRLGQADASPAATAAAAESKTTGHPFSLRSLVSNNQGGGPNIGCIFCTYDIKYMVCGIYYMVLGVSKIHRP